MKVISYTSGKARGRLAFFSLFLLFCLGCQQNPDEPIRVGISKWTGYEPLYLARERGYFETKNIRLVNYGSVTESARAFRNRAIDATANTLDEAIKMRSFGMDVKVIFVLDTSNGGDVLMARSEFKTITDLANRRIGVETTSLGDYVISRALQLSGMTSSDVQIIPLELFEQRRAFKEGRIDAVVTYEPVKTQLLAEGAVTLFDSSRIPNEIMDVLMVHGDLIKTRRPEIKELLQGWIRALEDVKRRDKSAIKIMADRQGLSESEFLATLDGLKLAGLEENLQGLSSPQSAYPLAARNLSENMRTNQLLTRDVDIWSMFDGSEALELQQ